MRPSCIQSKQGTRVPGSSSENTTLGGSPSRDTVSILPPRFPAFGCFTYESRWPAGDHATAEYASLSLPRILRGFSPLGPITQIPSSLENAIHEPSGETTGHEVLLRSF